jgi:hypothetical protein
MKNSLTRRTGVFRVGQNGIFWRLFGFFFRAPGHRPAGMKPVGLKSELR